MGSDYRHHHASHPAVIFVPMPVAGAPEPMRTVKPAKYQRTQHAPWRPATRPPSKAEALKRLLRDLAANDEAARSMLRPSPRTG
jgi:hypothetical protein